MLTYYSLRALTASARSIRPVGLAVNDRESWQRRVGLVYPLEQDPSTRQERVIAQDPSAYAEQRPAPQRLDMLTGRIPGTDIIIGMSRRLFEACRNLAYEEEQIAEETEPESQYGLFDLDEEVEEYTRERRAAFVEREVALRPRLRDATRQGFQRGRDTSWYQLLNQQPVINTSSAPELLEGATTDTYLAIERLSVFP
jgi:hypothetical protein